ncbi:OmpA/MotB domain-containing protein [Actinoplanes friuliensis DSM 7358]|uniref:OmpA/MotB domain-containing protein n=2 Tax=Actinoplanes friuliensis TaxID=196914 RepID=U5VZJ9_9ACTN|nr:OmpA/MotB domain-containing protein [Actinoplanes friuliensis DSM 7358]
MSVGPLIRSGGTVVLTVQTTLEQAGNGGAAVVSRHFSSILSTSFDAARLIDEAGRRVYLVSRNTADDGCVCTGLLRVEAGETRPLQAAFGGLPAGLQRVSVMLPHAGVFTDVPILDGAVPEPPTGVNAAGRVQKALDLSDVAASYGAGLEAYTERVGVGVRTRRGADQVDISLDTDVLFRLDSAKLTSRASKTIGAAVADLKAAGPGPLTVTGHTDSTGTTAHNQTLSEQRARVVSEALTTQLPDGQWPKTVAAKGESQPTVPNDSDANRALNRRVTITFKERRNNTGAGSTAPLPKTKGEEGKAPDGVEVSLPLNRGTIRFVPGAATVRGPFLLVNLTARNTGEGKATILDFLGQGVFTVRSEFDPFARYGAAGVRLLQGDTASYGLDYELEPGDHRCLCDRLLNQAIPPGSERLLSLWFPAPPAGEKVITIDVADRLRITDIPIS